MRYSIIFPAFAAAALAQSTTNYVSQTNSLGVVTGQPKPVTSQPAAVTTQPAVATAQSPAAVVPAGANSTFVIVPTGSAGNASSHTNGTVVNSASLKSTQTSSTTSHSSSSTSSGSSTKTSGSTTTSSGSTTSTSKASAADIIQPVLGLGFAGVIFAAFL